MAWMRISAVCLLLCGLLAGCFQSQEKDKGNHSSPGQEIKDREDPVKSVVAPKEDKAAPQEGPRVGQKEKYQSALSEAMALLAAGKRDRALIALETARAFEDTAYIKDEIERLRARIAQESAAQKTLQEIETILEEGRPAEAIPLVRSALREYGGSDVAPRLVQLRLEADALLLAQKSEDAEARFRRFRQEGEAALLDKNLRAAVLAFQMALQAREDLALQQKFEDLRLTLEKYDRLRNKAAELRRDPGQLEEALENLHEAARSWETMQIRQEIDDCTLALAKRRDRVGIADFEVRGAIGIPQAGKTIAEEILPHLKPRFDLVERTQIQKIFAELKWEGDLDPVQQRELGKLARVQYLVLGSISSVGGLGGLTVNARLVDVRSGLVVQTARVVAATPEELLPLLADLGQQLRMNDQEKMAYELAKAQKAKAALIPTNRTLPPLPEPPQEGRQLPAPIVAYLGAPPPVGAIQPQDLDLFAPPGPGPLPAPDFGGEMEIRLKQRLLDISVHLGDNFFRRGQFREAQRHFDFAVLLSPGQFDLGVRLSRCKPYLPPPPLTYPSASGGRGQGEGAMVPRKPGLAILPFLVRNEPPALGFWTTSQIAPYFEPYYDVVDSALVSWYMNQMDLTLADIKNNPYARRWLGRALGVRSFLFGSIQRTASFDVSAYLVDAEYGFLQGSGRIRHVHNPKELKWRLGELVRLTLLDPVERDRYLAQEKKFQEFFKRGREAYHRGEIKLANLSFQDALSDFDFAILSFRNALGLRPGHEEVLGHLHRAQRQAELAAFEAGRRQFQVQVVFGAQKRQWELAQAAELARLDAIRQKAALAEEERRLQEAQRRKAQLDLVAWAQVTFKTRNFQLSINFLESALALGHNDQIVRDLAQARLEADKAARLQAAQEQARREAELRKLREQELLQTRIKLEKERLEAQARAEALRKIQDQRDEAAYQAAFDKGQRLLAKEDFDGAIAALQTARRLKKTTAVETLLSQALVEQARAVAQARGDQARKELEQKLAEEKARREKAEAQARKNRDLYRLHLDLAQKAWEQKKFDEAQSRFQEAGKLFQTDEVLAGLRKIEEARILQADLQKKVFEAEQRNLEVKKFLAQGQDALNGKNFPAALKAFSQARKLAPDSLDAMTGMTRAEQALLKQKEDDRRQAEANERQQTFRKLLKSGQENLANKQFEAAVVTLTEALKLSPNDPIARNALNQAEKARAEQAAQVAQAAQAKIDQVTQAKKAQAALDAKKKAEDYLKLMAEGRLALSTKQFDTAMGAFAQAQKIMPGDRSSADFLEEARKGKQQAAEAVAAAAKKRAEELQKAADVKKALDQGRAALLARDLASAQRFFETAEKLEPRDPGVLRALADLRQARKQIQTEDDARKKKLDQHKTLLETGQQALNAKKYEDALKAFSEAAQLNPGDPRATQFLQQAQKAWNDAKKDAKAALDAEARKKAEEKQRQAQFNQEMKNAAALEKQQKFAEAIKTYEQALKLFPKDAKASAALRNAEFNFHLGKGQNHLNAKRYPEAIRAFEAALQLRPTDPLAAKLLKRAKQGK